jgi:hypothetical protein
LKFKSWILSGILGFSILLLASCAALGDESDNSTAAGSESAAESTEGASASGSESAAESTEGASASGSESAAESTESASASGSESAAESTESASASGSESTAESTEETSNTGTESTVENKKHTSNAATEAVTESKESSSDSSAENDGKSSESETASNKNSSKTSSESASASSSVKINKVVKVSATGEGLTEELLGQIGKLENVSKVRGYLAVTSGQTQILGVDTSEALQIEVIGKLVTPSVVEGRLLDSDDTGQNVMIAGKTFAENNETGYGYPILGMAAHNPPYILDNNEMTILGVYETGSAEADNRIILPLDTVQRLYGKVGQVNVVYMTINHSSAIDQVKKIVGEKVTIQELGG